MLAEPEYMAVYYIVLPANHTRAKTGMCLPSVETLRTRKPEKTFARAKRQEL